jgi:membrane protein YqaA with SNARE-associated domain
MKNPLRCLYDWVISWAKHPAGSWALFINAFVESSFFPVPPDALLIALGIGAPKRSFWYSTLCSVGSIIGGAFGYFIGWKLWELTSSFFFTYIFSEELFNKVSALYNENAFLSVLGAAFTPIPYKVFTIAAGVCQINFIIFMLASIIGRSGRFFLVSTVVFFFGARAKELIDKYFNLVTIVFFLLLIAGFIVLKFLIKR